MRPIPQLAAPVTDHYDLVNGAWHENHVRTAAPRPLLALCTLPAPSTRDQISQPIPLVSDAGYSPAALAAVCQEVERNARQLQRGIPGAAALLLRSAEAGGAESRDALLAAVTGAERHAMRWALRDAGDGPLSPARCRQAAQVLFAAR